MAHGSRDLVKLLPRPNRRPKLGIDSGGYPIQNGALLSSRSSLRPVPVGIAGPVHCRRLLGRRLLLPELTHSALVPHLVPGERMYHTGDLARYWADGTLEFWAARTSRRRSRVSRRTGRSRARRWHIGRARCGLFDLRGASGVKSLAAYVVAVPGRMASKQSKSGWRVRCPDPWCLARLSFCPFFPLHPARSTEGIAGCHRAPHSTCHVPPRTRSSENRRHLGRAAQAQTLGLDRRILRLAVIHCSGGHAGDVLKARLGIEVPCRVCSSGLPSAPLPNP